MEKKRGFIMGDVLGWWILALAVLVLMFIMYMILSDKGIGAIEYLKRIIRNG